MLLAACGNGGGDCVSGTPVCNSALTWPGVQPLFASACVSCHSQLASQEGVAAARQAALDQLQTCAMPAAGTLSRADRETLLAYLACH
jgi:hypothetical protein